MENAKWDPSAVFEGIHGLKMWESLDQASLEVVSSNNIMVALWEASYKRSAISI